MDNEVVLKKACRHLGVSVRQVMSWHVDERESTIALVIDKGKDGCPKYILPLSDLKGVKPVEVEEPEPLMPLEVEVGKVNREAALLAACEHLGVDPSQVMSVFVDEVKRLIDLVVNKGAAGCPEYKIPLADLEIEMVAADEALQAAGVEFEAAAPPVSASRAAKKLAQKHGVDLTEVAGTGKGGQITQGDVEAAIQ